MSKEALRTQLDSICWERDRLQAENARLRSEKPEQAAIAEVMAEVEGYKLENDRLANELHTLQSELSKGRHDSDRRCTWKRNDKQLKTCKRNSPRRWNDITNWTRCVLTCTTRR